MTKVDTYICPLMHTTVVRRTDEGEALHMITCPQCDKRGRNEIATGNIADQTLQPSYEWYKPSTKQELQYLLDHMTANAFISLILDIGFGGLLLRPIEKNKM